MLCGDLVDSFGTGWATFATSTWIRSVAGFRDACVGIDACGCHGSGGEHEVSLTGCEDNDAGIHFVEY